MNRANIVIQVLTLALGFLTQLEAIARQDPEVWNEVKDNFNKAKQQFKDA